MRKAFQYGAPAAALVLLVWLLWCSHLSSALRRTNAQLAEFAKEPAKIEAALSAPAPTDSRARFEYCLKRPTVLLGVESSLSALEARFNETHAQAEALAARAAFWKAPRRDAVFDAEVFVKAAADMRLFLKAQARALPSQAAEAASEEMGNLARGFISFAPVQTGGPSPDDKAPVDVLSEKAVPMFLQPGRESTRAGFALKAFNVSEDLQGVPIKPGMLVNVLVCWSYAGGDPDGETAIYVAADWLSEAPVIEIYRGRRGTECLSAGERVREFTLRAPVAPGEHRLRLFAVPAKTQVKSFYGGNWDVAKAVWSEYSFRVAELASMRQPCSLAQLEAAIKEHAAFTKRTLELADGLRAVTAKLGDPADPSLAESVNRVETLGRQSASLAQVLVKVQRDCVEAIASAMRGIQMAMADLEGPDAPSEDASAEKFKEFLPKVASAVKAARASWESLNWPTPPGYDEDFAREAYTLALQGEAVKLDQFWMDLQVRSAQPAELYEEALAEEATVTGKVARWTRDKVREFGKSRAGQELHFALRNVVLGARMLYEAFDLRSSADVQSWVDRHEADFKTIREELEKIRSMDGWSLTGVNTPLEAAVDRLYKKEFPAESSAVR